jgi:lysophospholipase L1-like esterase
MRITMKKVLKVIALLLGLLVLAMSWPAWMLHEEIQKSRSDDPLVWEEDIRALETATAGRYAPGQAVVFIGSSSIRLWDTLEEDMAPIPVLQHGFGGAKLNDVVHYADRLVSAYRPLAVVVFAGTNDIDPSVSKTPETLLASYQAFVDRVRSVQPDLPIFYIAITPSPRRWSVWPIAQATNRLIGQWSEADPNLHVIETSAALMDAAGAPDPDNYVFDGLHLSDRGYAAWTLIIRERLLDFVSGDGRDAVPAILKSEDL